MPKADIPYVSEPVERKMNPIFTSRNHSGFEEFNHLSQDTVVFYFLILLVKEHKTTSSAVADQGSPRAFTTFEPFIVFPLFLRPTPQSVLCNWFLP